MKESIGRESLLILSLTVSMTISCSVTLPVNEVDGLIAGLLVCDQSRLAPCHKQARFVFTANLTSGSISTHGVDSFTGSLGPLSTLTTAAQPRGVVVNSAGTFLYVTHTTGSTVATYSINTTTGTLTLAGSVPAGGAQPQGIALDPQGRFAFTGNLVGDNVSAYAIDQATGLLGSAVTTAAAGAGPQGVGVDPTGQYLYMAGNTSGLTYAYHINQTTGALTLISNYAAAAGSYAIGIDPMGRFVYTSNLAAGNSVSTYTINQSSGALTSNGNFASGIDPRDIVVEYKGSRAYVSNVTSSSIMTCDINPNTGTLAQTSTVASIAPMSSAIDPNGRFLIAASSSGNYISAFSINPSTGALNANGTSPVGTLPFGVAIASYIDTWDRSQIVIEASRVRRLSGVHAGLKEQELKDALVHEGMRALEVGAKYAIAVILVLGVVLFTLLYFGGYGWRSFPPPFILFAILTAISLILYFGLRTGRLGKRGVYAALIALACTPSAFFVAMNFVWQGGTAALFHGPIAYSYFAILVFTGLFFELRLSAIAGGLAALSFAIVYVVARPDLIALPIPDQTMHGVISGIVPNAMKTLVIFTTGLFVGVVARYSRSILSRMLAEQKEKGEIDRLFGEYVSAEVKEKIKSNPLSNGDRKHMAIMFTDLRGFTSLSEQTEPEEIVARLNLYFDEMVAAISTHGGVVDKFIGDAILATFGGVLDIESPCPAAYQAAEEMERRLKILNENWAVVGLAGLRHGIGLHYAQVLQGIIGSRNRKDYTVIGDGVNLASRVESLTKKMGQTLLLTGEFRAQLPAELQDATQQRWRVRVRGREAPLDVFTTNAH